MTFELLIAFNIALLAALASPGPAMLVAIRTTLSQGQGAGIALGCGLGLMAALWTLMALVGLESIFQLFPWGYIAAKTAGALYLLYIAWNTWRGARRAITVSSQPVAQAFGSGVLINFLNPKSVLFAAAVLVVIFPPDMTNAQKAIVVANHLGVQILFYGSLALAMSSEAVAKRYLRAKVYSDRIAAIVLAALGLRLLIHR